jgi:hypothetical protein
VRAGRSKVKRIEGWMMGREIEIVWEKTGAEVVVEI